MANPQSYGPFQAGARDRLLHQGLPVAGHSDVLIEMSP